MRSTWKRALSTLLTIAMIATLLVVPASAASSVVGNVTTYTLEVGTDITANPTENGGTYVDGYFTVNKQGAYDNTHNYTYHQGQADEYAPNHGLKVGNATEYATGKKAIYFTTQYANASVKVWWSPATNTGRWLRAWNDKNTNNLITDTDETQASKTCYYTTFTIADAETTCELIGSGDLYIYKVEVAETKPSVAGKTDDPSFATEDGDVFSMESGATEASSVTFTLSAAVTEETTYKLYDSTEATDARATATVSSGTELTFASISPAIGAGTYYVTATKGTDSESGKVAVTVQVFQKPATGVTLKIGEAAATDQTLTVAETMPTFTLSATVEPADTTDTLVFTSSNPNVATVSEAGVVTAVAIGQTTITAAANETAKAEIDVTVVGAAMEGPVYTLDPAKMADATASAATKYDANGYFTLQSGAAVTAKSATFGTSGTDDWYLAATKCVSPGSNGTKTKNSITFTTTESKSTVEIWWVQNADSSGNIRELTLDETTISSLQTIDGLAEGASLAKNGAYHVTVSDVASGEHYIHSPGGTNYICKVVVTEGATEQPAEAATTAAKDLISSLSLPENTELTAISFTQDLTSSETVNGETSADDLKAFVKKTLDAKLNNSDITVTVDTATYSAPSAEVNLLATTEPAGTVAYTATLSATSDSTTANIGGTISLMAEPVVVDDNVTGEVTKAYVGVETDGTDESATLAPNYTVSGTHDADTKTTAVTITADKVVKHAQSQAPNAEGFWLGFGMHNEKNQTYVWKYSKDGTSFSAVGSVATRNVTVDGKKVNTVYVELDKDLTDDGKFIMQQCTEDGSTVLWTYNVTVSPMPTLVQDYAITASAATNGSYTVKVGENEVTEAQNGATVTVTPTADATYELDTITVTKTDDESTTVNVDAEAHTFEMPAYPVTITVTFKGIPAVSAVAIQKDGSDAGDALSATYGDADITLTADVTGTHLTAEDKAVTWESSDATVATVADGVVKILKVGETTITAKSTKDEAKTDTVTLTVNKATMTGITAENVTATYDGTAKKIAVTGVPDGFNVTYAEADNDGDYAATEIEVINATTEAKTVYYKVTDPDGNYNDFKGSATITVNKADMPALTITTNPVHHENVIDHFTYAGGTVTVTVTGVPAGLTAAVTCESTGASVSDNVVTIPENSDTSNTKTYEIKVNVAGGDNYNDAAETTITVNQVAHGTKTINVTATDPATKTLEITSGQDISLGVTATASEGTLTYTWKKGEDATSLGTEATFSKTGALVADAGTYTCTIGIQDDTVTRDIVFTVTVNKKAGTVPTASFDAATMKLTGLVAGQQYSVDGGTNWTNVAEETTEATLENVTAENGIQVKAPATAEAEEAIQTITVTKATAPTLTAGDGQITITNYSSEATYEIKSDGAYADATVSSEGVISGLTNDTAYTVRVKAAGTVLASEGATATPVAAVVTRTLTFTVDAGATVTDVTVGGEGTTMEGTTLTVDQTKAVTFKVNVTDANKELKEVKLGETALEATEGVYTVPAGTENATITVTLQDKTVTPTPGDTTVMDFVVEPTTAVGPGVITTDVKGVEFSIGPAAAAHGSDAKANEAGYDAGVLKGTANPKVNGKSATGDNGIPDSGTVFAFKPTRPGTLKITYVLNANKSLVVMKDSAKVKAGIVDTANKVVGTETIEVTEADVNATYRIFASGSNLMISGFSFEAALAEGETYTSPLTTDFTAIDTAITAANTAKADVKVEGAEGVTIENGDKYVTAEVDTALTGAITAATAYKDLTKVTPALVTAAAAKLDAAVETYTAAILTKGDEDAITSVTINTPASTELEVEGTLTLTATKVPAASTAVLEWSSGDPTKATVDAATGVVTGVAEGTVTITVKAKDVTPEVSDTIELTIKPKTVIPEGTTIFDPTTLEGADAEAVTAAEVPAPFTATSLIKKNSGSGVYAVQTASKSEGSLNVTIPTGKKGTLVISTASTGGTNTTKFELVDANGTVHPSVGNVSSVTGGGDSKIDVTWNDLPAGTYSFKPAADSEKAARVYKATITMTDAGSTPVEEKVNVTYELSFDEAPATVPTAPAAVEIDKGGKVTALPTAPTVEGYTFTGWFVGETAFTTDTVVNENITVTGKYTKNTVTPGVDKTALTDAIAAAQADLDATVEATDAANVDEGTKWALKADRDAYQAAIDKAQGVVDNADATAEEVAAAVTELDGATTTFKAAQKDGTKVPEADKTELNAAIDAVELTLSKATVAENGDDVLTTDNWITAADKEAVETAIAAAKEVAGNKAATEEEVTAAITALNDAVAGKFQKGTKEVAKADLEAAIAAAKKASDAITVGEKAEDVTKGTAFVTKAVKDAYDQAIADAQAVIDALGDKTQEDLTDEDKLAIEAALGALNEATHTFELAKQEGTKSSGGRPSSGSSSTVSSSTDKTTETKPDGTKVVTETAKDGTVTVTQTKPDGTKVVTTTDKDGAVTGTVIVPSSVDKTIVSVPVADANTGMVAVIVNDDGTEEIIRGTSIDDGEVVFPMTESGKIKIVDNAKHFVDIGGHWAENDVNFVSARELFNGVDATHFAPDATMTRGMMATVLFRLDGETKSDKAVDFSDVKAGDWFADAVDWAAEVGVINGYTDGTFAPNQSITREELVVMVYRYAGAPEADATVTGFNDADQVADWAAAAMNWAIKNGIINGKGNGILDPKGNATRAEVSAVLERFVKLANQ